MIARRWLVIALGLRAIAVPLTVKGQQRTRPARIGLLVASSPETIGPLVDAFKKRLVELGSVEGKDVEFTYRWALGKAERFPQLAQELVALQPDIIFATG